MKKLSESEAKTLNIFLEYLSKTNVDAWPTPRAWPNFPGLPEYSIFMAFLQNGTRTLGISFSDGGVMMPHGDTGEILFFSNNKEETKPRTSLQNLRIANN